MWVGAHSDGGPGAGKIYSSVLSRYVVFVLKVHGIPAEPMNSAGVTGPVIMAEASLGHCSARTDEPESDDLGDMASTLMSSG